MRIIFVLICLLILTACTTTPSLKVTFEELNLSRYGPYASTSTGRWPICGDYDHPNKTVVIRTQAEYDIFLSDIYQASFNSYRQDLNNEQKRGANFPDLNYDEYFDLCDRYPQIDFSKKTILKNAASGGGCSTNFKKLVLRDDTNKKVTYTVQSSSIGGCDMLKSSQNLITVDAIPSDYEVIFID